LALESEATTLLMMRLARAFDGEPEFRRLATAVSKFWCCKRAIAVVSEALECHGGNGYVEESILPRLYREAPLNSIWEGSGNVNALDVLRAMGREPESVEAYFAEVEQSNGADRRFDAALAGLRAELTDPADAEGRARRLVERMATVLQASLLLRHGDPAVADIFCASRLGDGGHTFGTLHPDPRLQAIVERARPTP